MLLAVLVLMLMLMLLLLVEMGCWRCCSAGCREKMMSNGLSIALSTLCSNNPSTATTATEMRHPPDGLPASSLCGKYSQLREFVAAAGGWRRSFGGLGIFECGGWRAVLRSGGGLAVLRSGGLASGGLEAGSAYVRVGTRNQLTERKVFRLLSRGGPFRFIYLTRVLWVERFDRTFSARSFLAETVLAKRLRFTTLSLLRLRCRC